MVAGGLYISNCAIRQTTQSNTITISASVGGGQGEPCEEVPLSPTEFPPGNSSLLSGGPACNDLIQAINGISGSSLQLVAGTGVRINLDPDDPHHLIVSVDLHDLTYCPDRSSESL